MFGRGLAFGSASVIAAVFESAGRNLAEKMRLLFPAKATTTTTTMKSFFWG